MVSRMHLGRDHRARVQINSMLGLVGQMGRAVLHARDPRLRIGHADPLVVRQRLTPALPVQANEVFGAYLNQLERVIDAVDQIQSS